MPRCVHPLKVLQYCCRAHSDHNAPELSVKHHVDVAGHLANVFFFFVVTKSYRMVLIALNLSTIKQPIVVWNVQIWGCISHWLSIILLKHGFAWFFALRSPLFHRYWESANITIVQASLVELSDLLFIFLPLPYQLPVSSPRGIFLLLRLLLNLASSLILAPLSDNTDQGRSPNPFEHQAFDRLTDLAPFMTQSFFGR